MPTEAEMNQALEVLRQKGRSIAAPETSTGHHIVIPIDGIPRTPEEICEMAERLKEDS